MTTEARILLWQKNNRDRINNNQRNWRKRNPEKRREAVRRYAERHPEKVKEQKKRAHIRFRKMHPHYLAMRYINQRLEIFDLLGNKCNHCGITDMRVLQIDEINGGGTKQRANGMSNYYTMVLKKVKAGSKEYQLLCAIAIR